MQTNFSPTSLLPMEQAARLEYEYYGSTLTTNTALKAALLCAFLIIGLLSWNTVRLARLAATVKPLIIRVNEVGRAEALAYQDFTYKPQAPEIRYFLTQFVTGYYSRNHKTVEQAYVNSLYFWTALCFPPSTHKTGVLSGCPGFCVVPPMMPMSSSTTSSSKTCKPHHTAPG